MLKTTPAVFAVGDRYQIMVQVRGEAMVGIRIGDRIWYDASNGIMNSLSELHRVTVPMAALDAAKEYTLLLRPIIARKPYFTETRSLLEYAFPFSPVPESDIRLYHIADAHNRIEEPVRAAETFGRIDALVLNGDVIDHSGDPEKFSNIYEICSRLTKGSVPVVFSRGNHDMRGSYAERFANFTPSLHGKTYYSFRLGRLWGIVLDCGEDKDDAHPEYGMTVACHAFREEQTDFLRSIAENPLQEYAAPGVTTRLVIAHNPFSMKHEPPFDIEENIYRQWCRILRERIKPYLMLCGHMHECGIHPAGGVFDHYGQPCTLILGAAPQKDRFIGCGLIIGNDEISVVFTDSLGNTVQGGAIPILRQQ